MVRTSNSGIYSAKRSAQSYFCANSETVTPNGACGSACGAGDAKPEPKPAACGSACGTGDK
ncbi:MAG: ACGX-repeat peptide [Bacteroidia bacterium]|nr:ACGX-repeat peptide [Bacteroidia bacterium]